MQCNMEEYVMIINVYNKDNLVAFIPINEFRHYFRITNNKYVSIDHSKFSQHFTSDTLIQECILNHPKSCYIIGKMINIIIRNIYYWKDSSNL